MITFDDYKSQILDARRPGAGPENLVLLDTIDSTNRLASRMVRDYLEESLTPPPALLLACKQTGGKGRQGRTWESPRGGGLYATRVVISEAAEALTTLPLLVAVGMARALRAMLGGRGASCGIKWPNDLLVEGRKIGGILIEAVSRGESRPLAIVGYGANHSASHTGGDEVPVPKATTLGRELCAHPEAGELPGFGDFVWALVGAVEAELEHLGDMTYAVGGYQELTVHRTGDPVRCRMGGEVVRGTFRGFDERGFLLLETDAGIAPIAAGEVIEG